jgi:peptide/nickel transport system substrate-binding protein
MKSTLRLATATVTGLALLSTAACTGSSSSGSAGDKVVDGGSLNIAIGSDPGNLDPQRSVASLNVGMARFAYDTPITLDKGNKVVPGIVTGWTAGAKSYLLTVRKGVTCADGSAMDAKTVADNINYVGDKKSKSPYADVAVPAGTTATADNTASTVSVALPAAAPFFVQNLVFLALVCEKGLTDRSKLASASDGSGPYVLSQVVPGDHLNYTVRKGYDWGPGGASTAAKGIPAKLTFKLVKSDTTAANLLLNGQLNLAQVQGSDQTRLKAARLPSAGILAVNDELTFNHTAGSPGADVNVRRALVMALDLDQLTKVDTSGAGVVATGLLADPKICAGNTVTGNLPSYDQNQAKATLDQAGWTGGSGSIRSKGGKRLSMTLLYGANSVGRSSSAEFVAAQWRRLGVQVKLDQKPEDQVVTTILGTAGVWDAVLEPIGVTNPATIVPFLSGPVPASGTNFARIDNAQYDAAVKQAQAQNGAAGCPAWNRAEASLFKDADLAPISDLPQLYWGKGARFDVFGDGVLSPTSLRVLAG